MQTILELEEAVKDTSQQPDVHAKSYSPTAPCSKASLHMQFTWPCTTFFRDFLAGDELARHGMDDSQLPLSYNSPPNTSLTCPADGSATQLSHPVSQLGHIGRVGCSAC